jgi:histidinol-phosphate aminotransferase
MTYEAPSRGRSGLRLHLNENTAGCSPSVLAALRAMGREDAAFYPDYADATAACEAWFGVAPGWVQLVNGLDEGLQVVALRAALHDRTHGNAGAPAGSMRAAALVVEPAFEMYAICAEAAGLAVVRIPPKADFRFPASEILAELTPATRLVYLTDPNNPTGVGIPSGDVVRIARALPHGLVLIDEAYAEFSGRTCIGPTLDAQRNIVVGRTFAKAHGLAALRAGALVAHPDTLAPLRRLLLPFSVNVCALVALQAALQDRAYVDGYIAQATASRALIYEFCDRLGLKYWPSEANFVLLQVGDDAGLVAEALAERGILVRDRSSAPGCAGCLRITAGIVEHTRACLNALEDILATRRD